MQQIARECDDLPRQALSLTLHLCRTPTYTSALCRSHTSHKSFISSTDILVRYKSFVSGTSHPHQIQVIVVRYVIHVSTVQVIRVRYKSFMPGTSHPRQVQVIHVRYKTSTSGTRHPSQEQVSHVRYKSFMSGTTRPHWVTVV